MRSSVYALYSETDFWLCRGAYGTCDRIYSPWYFVFFSLIRNFLRMSVVFILDHRLLRSFVLCFRDSACVITSASVTWILVRMTFVIFSVELELVVLYVIRPYDIYPVIYSLISQHRVIQLELVAVISLLGLCDLFWSGCQSNSLDRQESSH